MDLSIKKEKEKREKRNERQKIEKCMNSFVFVFHSTTTKKLNQTCEKMDIKTIFFNLNLGYL